MPIEIFSSTPQHTLPTVAQTNAAVDDGTQKSTFSGCYLNEITIKPRTACRYPLTKINSTIVPGDLLP